MNMKKIIFLICFLFFFAKPIFSQILYLKMENAHPKQGSTGWFYESESNQKMIKGYTYINYSYKGLLLGFFCKDKSLYCQTVPASSIGNYPVKTLEELEAYLSNFTEQQKVDYFDNLQKIYIVEVFPNSDIIEVVEVELSIYEL